jgi:hypothetical protein
MESSGVQKNLCAAGGQHKGGREPPMDRSWSLSSSSDNSAVHRAAQSFGKAVIIALISVLPFSNAFAQTETATPSSGSAQTETLGHPCNLMTVPNDLLEIAKPEKKQEILKALLPCQEAVSTLGPAKTGLQNLQRGFDFYSWLTFIALNAPVRGSIDKSNPGSPTKWEDKRNFKQLLDVMVEDPDKQGNAPRWETQVIPPGCVEQHNQNPNLMIIKMIEETFNQPFKTGPLIDQHGNYALFDILMDRQMFDYIKNNHLYSRSAQMSAEKADLRIDFPVGENPSQEKPNGDPGAIMLKVSWKILEPPDDNQKFHTVDALVSMPKVEGEQSEPPCLRKTLGLVGFHIVHKTINRPQWIWTTFEHVDNVPEQIDVDAHNLERSYNFFDPTCNREKCPLNELPPRPWDPDPGLKLKFHGPFNSQITRVIPLTDDTRGMNRHFQRLLSGTVWRNYMLISTQWPSGFRCATQLHDDSRPEPHTDFEKQPDMNCAPAPAFLANSTLETYSQGSVPLASSSCMACHGNAVSYQKRPPGWLLEKKFFNQSDFTFTLEKAR